MSAERGLVRRLFELTEQLLGRLPLEQALQAVTEATLELLPGDHASVRMLDDTGTRLLCGARAGVGVENRPLTFRPGEGAMGWAVIRNEVVRIDDAETDSRFKHAPGQGFAVRSVLVVPLWCDGKVVGVLGASSPESRAFCADDELLARLLANCTSPYLEQARVERLLITDPVTMAFNERYLHTRLGEEFERARRNETRLSLLLMELDHPEPTDSALGQRLLQCFADRVRVSVRLSDILVRRGERAFALVMPDMPLGPASVVADRIGHSLSTYGLDLGTDLQLTHTVSLGVACWTGQEAVASLEARAAAALAEARRRGGNCAIRARHPGGRQLDARGATRCLREGCDGELEPVEPEEGRPHFRCSRESCRSIWHFGS
jgi:diguanylate cyclase (GGDEF)-like protein